MKWTIFKPSKTTQRLWNQLLSTAREPLLILDENFRILAASEAFYRDFNGSPEDTLGQRFFDLDHCQWDIPDLRLFLETLLGPKITLRDYRVVHDFSSLGWRALLMNACRINQGLGRRRMTLLAIEDITDRQQSDFGTLSRPRMEALATQAGGIAQEFNHLLDGMASIDRATTVISRGEQLSRQLLTLCQGGSPVLVPTLLGPWIKDWVASEFPQGSITARTIISPGLWPVDCDIRQIGRVMVSILVTARRASPLGGTVLVKASNDLKRGPVVSVEVRDQGLGQPAEDSGLDLTLATALARQHGGWIDVRSQVGVGSTLVLNLPASVRSLAPGGPHESRIAVVLDDDDGIRESIAGLVGSLGFEVLCAKDGQEVLALEVDVRRSGRAVEVFLLDERITGGLGGLVTARRLVARGAKGQILITSGSVVGLPGTVPIDNEGFWRISKPFTVGELSHLLLSLSR